MNNKLKKILCALLAACFVLVPLYMAAAAQLGDVDADGKVAAADARLALRAAVRLENIAAGSAAFTAADVNFDNKITSEDARLILRASVGLEELGAPQTPTGKTEYDDLRSGTFYIKAIMSPDDGASPMTMAVSSDVIYMAIEDGDLAIGYLVKGNDMFLVNEKGKTYWKPNALEKGILTGFGLPDAKELKQQISEFGFTTLAPLSQADSVTSGTLDGAACTVYAFNLSDGSVYKVYMSGTKLRAMETIAADGTQDSFMKVTEITGTLPALPPSDYKKVGMTAFMSGLM